MYYVSIRWQNNWRLPKAHISKSFMPQLFCTIHGEARQVEMVKNVEHHITSARFAGEVLLGKGWPEEAIQAVQHCILAHRYRGKEHAPETLEAKVLFDADKLDVLGAIGVARTIAFAALEGEPAYAEPSEQFLKTKKVQNGEVYSSYHEFLFKLANVKDRMFTSSGKAIAEARHAFLVAFYEQLQAEMRGER